MITTRRQKRSKAEEKSKPKKKIKIDNRKSQLKFGSSVLLQTSSPPSSPSNAQSDSNSEITLSAFDNNDYKEFLKFKEFQESQQQHKTPSNLTSNEPLSSSLPLTTTIEKIFDNSVPSSASLANEVAVDSFVVPSNLNFPSYFIKIGDGSSEVVLNLGAFDFSYFAKDQLNWFTGQDDLIFPQTPRITSDEATFDIFSAKLLRLLQNYSVELKQYFPKGMNSILKTAFSASIVAKFPFLEIKYQNLKLKQNRNEYIGAHAKTKSLRWPSVLGMIQEKWSNQIDNKNPDRQLKKPGTSEKTRLRNLLRSSVNRQLSPSE